MADAPIHDLAQITFQEGQPAQKTFLFIATEGNATKAQDQPGCLFSDDNGLTWTYLGVDGPYEVVALAIVQTSANEATLWIGAEEWIETDVGMILAGKVYQYELSFDASTGSIDASQFWEKLISSEEMKTFSILSMTAAKKTNDSDVALLLFVGTEKGVYQYDATTRTWLRFVKKQIAFDVDVFPIQSMPHLLVATHKWIRLIAFSKKAKPRHIINYVLTTTINSAQDTVWAGSAFDNVQQFDIATMSWQTYADVHEIAPLHRPIYCLYQRVEQEQQVLYAGTNDGIYRSIDGQSWTSFNAVSPQSESLAETIVVALTEVNDMLIAGTAQRGLWRHEAGGSGWVRVSQGLARIGRLVDAQAPRNPMENGAEWVTPLTNALAANGIGTHILHIPRENFTSLSFDLHANADVTLSLYYASPHIDLTQGNAAGLQWRPLVNQSIEEEPLKSGFYLVVVKAQQSTEYEISATLRNNEEL
ncbi:MAG: hypothetical protein AAF639_46950 [Chloroflexota bacterium]